MRAHRTRNRKRETHTLVLALIAEKIHHWHTEKRVRSLPLSPAGRWCLSFQQHCPSAGWSVSTSTLVYTNILSLLDYNIAFLLACQPLDLPCLHTPYPEQTLKHISDHVIPLLKTFHLLLIGPKTLWWLIRLHIHRPLFISDIVPFFSVLPQPSGCTAIILNFSGFRESVMLYLNEIPLHVLFPLTKILEYLFLPFPPHLTIISGLR